MSRPWLTLALWAAAAGAAGCGARTGLLDDGEAPDADAPDADAPDADGAFPCNYGRIGELAPLAPSLELSSAPDLAWGAGRLAAVVTTTDPDGRLLAMACTTDAGQDWSCPEPLELGTLDPFRAPPPRLAWDGEAFGACWLEDGHGRIGRFQRITPGGLPLWDAPASIVGAEGSCRDLVWAGDRYVVTLGSNIGDPEQSTAVVTMDQLGTVQEELLLVERYLGAQAPLALAADGARAAAAWIDADGIHVRGLLGPDDSEITFSGWPAGGHLDLALAGSDAGLLWAVEDSAGFSLYLTRVDLDTGGAGDPVVVGQDEAGLAGADIVAVAEGYLIAWNEWSSEPIQRTVLVPTRSGPGLTVEVRSPTTLFEGAMTGVTIDPGSPAFAYDGTDAYIGVTVPREDDGRPEVRTQVLACHR